MQRRNLQAFHVPSHILSISQTPHGIVLRGPTSREGTDGHTLRSPSVLMCQLLCSQGQYLREN